MKRQRHSSRGAALLAAMLMVSLVAMLAAGAAWQQWRTVEVESTERQHAQAQWLLLGALDWARVILREDARSGNPDAPHRPFGGALGYSFARSAFVHLFVSQFIRRLPSPTGLPIRPNQRPASAHEREQPFARQPNRSEIVTSLRTPV